MPFDRFNDRMNDSTAGLREALRADASRAPADGDTLRGEWVGVVVQ